MSLLFKRLWFGSTAVGTTALIYTLLGLTAAWQRIPEWEIAVMLFAWPPVFVLTILFVRLQSKGWTPSGRWTHLDLSLGMAVILVMSILLFAVTSPVGWLVPRVQYDKQSLTSDGHYEYRLQIINFWRRNTRARLLPVSQEKRLFLTALNYIPLAGC